MNSKTVKTGQFSFEPNVSIDVGPYVAPFLLGSALGYFLAPGENKLQNALLWGLLASAGTHVLKNVQGQEPEKPSLKDAIQTALWGTPVAGGIGGYFWPELLGRGRLPASLTQGQIRQILEEYARSLGLADPFASGVATYYQRQGLDFANRSPQQYLEELNNLIRERYTFAQEYLRRYGYDPRVAAVASVPPMGRADINRVLESLRPTVPFRSRMVGAGIGTLGGLIAMPFLNQLIEELM